MFFLFFFCRTKSKACDNMLFHSLKDLWIGCGAGLETLFVSDEVKVRLE